MEFLGITHYGPQNYIKDMLRPEYTEPMLPEHVKPLMQKITENSICPTAILRPDVDSIRTIDCYMGLVNGFAYGSKLRFTKMKTKGVIKPAGPIDMYRLPPATSIDYGWWLCDAALKGKTWQHTYPRCPQPISPNTLILDKVRKNNKYATLF